jgi:hypothetical protein
VQTTLAAASTTATAVPQSATVAAATSPVSGAGASGPAAAVEVSAEELPDEDTLVLPASWLRAIHPRRGGMPGPAVVVAKDADASLRALLAAKETEVDQVLANPASDPVLVAQATAWRTGDGPVTPTGAAAIAALVLQAARHDERDRTRVFADAWVGAHGVVFAARATVEMAGLAISIGRGLKALSTNPSGRPFIRVWTTDDGPQQWHGWAEQLVFRMRAHLAAATDDDHAAAVTALSEFRDGSPRQRQLIAYLLPTQADWVANELTGRVHFGTLDIAMVQTVDQLELVVGNHANVHELVSSTGLLATVADGVGPALAPVVDGWLGTQHTAHYYWDTDDIKRLLGVLSAVPTDEAFGLLLARMEQKHVRAAVLEAMKRFPARALRMLAAAAAGTSATARASAELLRSHVIVNPAVASAVGPTLPAEAAERIAAIAASSVVMPDAPAEQLPALLVSPPWTVRRAAAKPTVVTGLVAPVEAAMAWAPGEQESWAALRGEVYLNGDPTPDWPHFVTEFKLGKLDHWDQIELIARGPAELVRPLLPPWTPSIESWGMEWLKCAIAKYGVELLPGLLRTARTQPVNTAPVVAPFAATELAPLVADWFGRLKSLRGPALAWLTRHPLVAARGLLPAALGKAGKERRAAETALRAIVAAGHHDTVVEAAREHGPAAVAGIEALVAADPLAVLPAKIPELPTWVEPAPLPQILLRGQRLALPTAAVRHVCTALALSRPGEVYGGVAVIREACDPASLAEFGWALFQQWRNVDFPPKDGWVLDALGWIGNDDTVRRLAPIIRAWPGEGGHARAVAGLEVLAAIGTDVALMHLNGIAEKVKFRGLKDKATEKIAEVAADRGLTAEELADRLVPELGLDADGSLTLDYGPRQFVVGFDEQLKPYVADAGGARRKDLPKPGARDDATLAPEAYQRFAGLKKDVRTIAADQIRRLERAMVTQRRWSGAAFGELFVRHPLLWHIVRRLVWAVFDADGAVTGALRVAEDRGYATVDDDAMTVADDALVGIAHPLHLGDSIGQWAELFADYEILQPFPQLGRDVHALTDEERPATTRARLAGRVVPSTTVLGLEKHGWRRGEPQDGGGQGWMYRDLPGIGSVVLDLDPGFIIGDLTYFDEQKVESVWLCSHAGGGWGGSGELRFGQLDAVTASEILRDLTTLET